MEGLKEGFTVQTDELLAQENVHLVDRGSVGPVTVVHCCKTDSPSYSYRYF